MRTNIVIDDTLMDEARKITGIKTKRMLVEEALRTLIRLRKQAAIKGLRGQLHWEGEIAEWRENRYDAG